MDRSREVRIRGGKDSEFAQREHRNQRKASNIPQIISTSASYLAIGSEFRVIIPSVPFVAYPLPH